MHRVLFVDDEPNVLRGFKRSLRELEDQYELTFADSGAKAIEILRTKYFDIVISDIHMPGIDGIKVLGEVKANYPKTIRLALTGAVASELNRVNVAHQFLAKPLDSSTLKSVLHRVANLKSAISDENLRTVLGDIDALPSPPSLYHQVLHEAENPDCSLKHIGEIISSDVAMTAKILQLVNSAFYGLAVDVESVTHAVNLLGTDVICGLVLAQEAFDSVAGADNTRLDVNALNFQCQKISALAKQIAKFEALPKKWVDQSQMAGMIHNVGKLVLASRFPEKYQRVLDRCEGLEHLTHETEISEFGVSHAHVGSYLMGIWGLPPMVVEAVSLHHTPSMSAAVEFNVLSCIYIAIRLSDADSLHHTQEEFKRSLDEAYINKVSDISRAAKWFDLAKAVGS
jgi:HD-like signal output (HDOD) protein/CheY-like chemotaxis protein